MGISTSSSLMVGLPYKELKALVRGFDEDVYDIDIDEMIYNGALAIGSIGYDSDKKYNIVGIPILSTDSFFEVDSYILDRNRVDALNELEEMIPTVKWKLYLTLDVT